MKILNKGCALFLCVLLVFSLCAPIAAAENDATVRISTAEELLSFSENCKLDTWSKGKTVLLEADIDLTGVRFTPIPIFCGSFDGQGHSITGLSLIGVSGRGVFNIIGEAAVVKNLNVVGVVTPSGSEKYVGGICGTNSGTITGCNFNGAVAGTVGVGGIAGQNTESGEITACHSDGSVDGDQYVGGVAGHNQGAISQCQNAAAVNTTNEEKQQSLADIDVDSLLNFDNTTVSENPASANDVGGIAGYSDGMILSCVNHGGVGYPHIGYNVGGIVGRTSGFVSNCRNECTLNGRKDVGGISGQMEPYLIINISPDGIASLQGQLSTLNTMVNTTLDSAQSASSTVTARLGNISGYLKNALDSVNTLANGLGGYGETIVSEIDRGSVILSDVITRLSGITAGIPNASQSLESGLVKLSEAMDALAAAGEISEEAMQSIDLAMADMQAASTLLQSGGQQINNGIAELIGAVTVDDEDAVRQALEKIADGTEALAQAAQVLGASLATIAELLSTENALTPEVLAEIQNAASALSDAGAALETIMGGIQEISAQVSIDWDTVQNGATLIQSGASALVTAMGSVESALSHFSDALQAAREASEVLDTVWQSLSESASDFSDTMGQFTVIAENLNELFSYLSGVDPIQIGQIDEGMQQSGNALYAAISGLTGELESLNTELSSATSSLLESLRQVNNQAALVASTLTGLLYEQESSQVSDLFEDTSDTEIDSVTSGKVSLCQNSGEIYGDLNVGGITGLMAIEYDYDPEDDIMQSGSSLLNRSYETKAVIQACVNTGGVTAKKNYVGGIVGQMNLGYVTRCEGYGSIASESGDYVGGIAGRAVSKIKSSFSKATLSGRDYTGGVAGSGDWIADCYTLVQIHQTGSFVGAVSGNDDGEYTGNYFVSDALAGLSGVSYAGRAEPISYAALLAVSGLPDAFRNFTLRFIADGKTIKEQSFSYDVSFGKAIFPDVPAKEGYYGKWDISALENLHFDVDVTAVYQNTVTALTSDTVRENGQPVWIVEGLFTGESSMTQELTANGAKTLEEDAEAYRQTIERADSSLFYSVDAEATEQWQLSFSDDGLATHRLRYLPSGTAGQVRIFVRTAEGTWEEVETSQIDTYLAFEITGSEADVIAVYTQLDSLAIAICAAAALMFVLLVILLKNRRKSRRRRKRVRRTHLKNAGTKSKGENS